MKLSSRHLLGIDQLTTDEIRLILETADGFIEVAGRSNKRVPALKGKLAINWFVESSTRTRISFEIAEKRLSCDTLSIAASGSSMSKGETLLDTARTLEAMDPFFLVLRHSEPGASHLVARSCRASVINAGDGAHEHPTQALLDAMTIRQHFGRIGGLKIVLVGDIKHSRVARSNILLLNRLGAEVVVCGPPSLLPAGIEAMGVTASYDPAVALEGADVVMALRMQMERQGRGYVPSLREYARLYGLTQERLEIVRPDAIVMHPGPINRGVEIDGAVADRPRSVILDQVTNGVAVRMAVLYLLAGGERGNATAQES